MTITTTTTRPPVTAEASFSFYIGSSRPSLILDCAKYADAVTVKGSKGPKTIAKLREAGFDCPVLFDGECWRFGTEPLDPAAWVNQQVRAGADQVLTPGRLVEWNRDSKLESLQAVAAELRIAETHGADALLAVDARWLIKDLPSLMGALENRSCDLALVLVDPNDPLKRPEAVEGLKVLAGSIPRLRLLRSDHGALGGVAYGLSHAAIGLSTTNRHGTTANRPGSRKPDRSPRVFSLMFADWFAASILAGWALVDNKPLVCHLQCCGGQTIDRFLDEDFRAEVPRHNMTSLKWLADHILNAPADERRRVFLDYCRSAADRYAEGGDRGPGSPKAQLTNWVLS